LRITKVDPTVLRARTVDTTEQTAHRTRFSYVSTQMRGSQESARLTLPHIEDALEHFHVK